MKSSQIIVNLSRIAFLATAMVVLFGLVTSSLALRPWWMDCKYGYTTTPTIACNPPPSTVTSTAPAITSGQASPTQEEESVKHACIPFGPGITYAPKEGASPPITPVARWQGDGDARDSIGQNHGTLLNGATIGPGKFGQSFVFDGHEDKVSFGNNPSLNVFGGDFTMVAWINPLTVHQERPTSASGPGAMNIITNRNVNDHFFNFAIQEGQLVYVDKTSDESATVIRSTKLLTPAAWSHVAITRAGSTYTLFFNGVQDISLSGAPLNSWSGQNVVIGDENSPVQGPFKGSIDEVEIYNRALTTEEVEAKFKSTPQTITPLQGTISRFRGEGDAKDDAGRFDGTIQGPVKFTGGRVGSAIQVGPGAYVGSIGSTSTYDFIHRTGKFTIHSWIRLDDNNALNEGGIFSNAWSSSQTGFYFNWDNRQRASEGVQEVKALRFVLTNGGATVFYMSSSPNSITDNNWHHVAVVGDGKSVTMYVDGVSKGTQAFNGLATGSATNTAAIGNCRYDGDTCFFQGRIDELNILNRSLSADDIASIARGDTQSLGIEGATAFTLASIAGGDPLRTHDVACVREDPASPDRRFVPLECAGNDEALGVPNQFSRTGTTSSSSPESKPFPIATIGSSTEIGATIKTSMEASDPPSEKIPAAHVVNPLEGSIEIKLMPSWDGNDGLAYRFIHFHKDDKNEIIIEKTSENKIRCSYKAEGIGSETSVSVSGWLKAENHRVVMTWSKATQTMGCSIDDQPPMTSPLRNFLKPDTKDVFSTGACKPSTPTVCPSGQAPIPDKPGQCGELHTVHSYIQLYQPACGTTLPDEVNKWRCAHVSDAEFQSGNSRGCYSERQVHGQCVVGYNCPYDDAANTQPRCLGRPDFSPNGPRCVPEGAAYGRSRVCLTCPNGVVDAGESCDDANTANRDGCSSACQKETGICGDKVIESTEDCDDGDKVNQDGCSSSCQKECAESTAQYLDGYITAGGSVTGGLPAKAKMEMVVFATAKPTIAYCTKDGSWAFDLDQYDQQSCAQSKLRWTGTKCCGEAIDKEEFYNDIPPPAPSESACAQGDLSCSKGGTKTTGAVIATVFGPPKQSLSLPQQYSTTTPGACWNSTYYQSGRIPPGSDDQLLSAVGRFYSCGNSQGNPLFLIKDSHTRGDLVSSAPVCSLVHDIGGDPRINFYCSAKEGRWVATPNNKPRPLSRNPANENDAECCPQGTCWAGGPYCVGDQSQESGLATTNGFRCINGQWETGFVKYRWDRFAKGYCPRPSQCLVNPAGSIPNNDQPETFFSAESPDEQPACIDDGQFILENMCDAGGWTSRAKAIAYELIDIGERESPTDYSVFCGNHRDVLNFLEYNPSTSGKGSLTHYFDDPCTVDGEKVPCANNFCAMRFSGNKIAFGTSVNVPIDDPTQGFLSALGLSSKACDNAKIGDGTFHQCKSKDWVETVISALRDFFGLTQPGCISGDEGGCSNVVSYNNVLQAVISQPQASSKSESQAPSSGSQLQQKPIIKTQHKSKIELPMAAARAFVKSSDLNEFEEPLANVSLFSDLFILKSENRNFFGFLEKDVFFQEHVDIASLAYDGITVKDPITGKEACDFIEDKIDPKKVEYTCRYDSQNARLRLVAKGKTASSGAPETPLRTFWRDMTSKLR